MRRHFAVLGKTDPVSTSDSPGPFPNGRPSEYADLIQQLFRTPSVVAVIGSGMRNGVTEVCEGIASELSRSGRHVVIVAVSELLQASSLALSDEAAVMPQVGRHVWLWPSRVGQQFEFAKSRSIAGADQWLDRLRQNFDSVILDCPSPELMPGGAAIAALAESAVLAVDALETTKYRVLADQRLLQLSGVKLAGCILVNAR